MKENQCYIHICGRELWDDVTEPSYPTLQNLLTNDEIVVGNKENKTDSYEEIYKG